MLELVFMVGPSGSGKSTWVKKQGGYKVVCPDEIRAELSGDVSDQSVSRRAWEIALHRTSLYLATGSSVILDGINTTSKNRGKFLKEVKYSLGSIKYTTKAVVVYNGESVDELYGRVSSDIENGIVRSKVPHDIIERQVTNFENGKQNLVKQFDEVVYLSSMERST